MLTPPNSSFGHYNPGLLRGRRKANAWQRGVENYVRNGFLSALRLADCRSPVKTPEYSDCMSALDSHARWRRSTVKLHRSNRYESCIRYGLWPYVDVLRRDSG